MKEIIGDYLRKKIYYMNIHASKDYQDMNLENSIVMLYINNPHETDETLTSFFKRIIADDPIAVLIAGINYHHNLKLFINIASRANIKRHIMTNLGDREDYLDGFFLATMPVEERHDDWKDYLVIEIGEPSIKEEIINYDPSK